MTVTGATPLLILFRSRIEDAVGLVPDMGAEEKLKAVQFWNVVSEKLQEIVNNSAADINALALKMDEEQVDKLSLEIGAESSSCLTTDSNVCTSSFIDASSNYAVCGDADSHFETAVINNSQEVVNFLSSQTPLSDIATTSLPKHLSGDISEVVSLESITNNDISSKNVSSLEQFSNVESTSKGDCVLISSLSSVSSDITAKHGLLNNSSLVLQSEVDCGLSSAVSKAVCPRPRRERSKRPITRRTKGSKAFSLNTTAQKIDVDINLSESLSEKKSSLTSKSIISTSPNVSDEESFVVNSDGTIISSDAEGKTALNSKRTLCKGTSGDEDLDPISEVISEKANEMKKNSDSNRSEKANEQVKDVSDSYMEDEDSCDKDGDEWQSSNKPHACSECNSKFATKGNLIVHLRRHTGERPFSCPQCSARFSTRGNLKRHIKTHSGEKPWECAQCGTRFTEKKSLKVHMRRHTGEKPYQCTVCAKKFSQTGILQTHMAMHLEQKAHLCEHCGKSFRQKSQLRLHMLRHEGVKKYCCKVCASRFLTKGDLERHTRVHTGERPFICELCGKTFTRQQSLNEHMNRHYGLKPYECKYCGKSFAEMSACYKHIKHHEKQQIENGSEKVISENGTHQTSVPLDADLQLPSSDAMNHIIVGSEEYEELPAQKFTVILHNNNNAVEVMEKISVENQDHIKNSYVITASSASTNLDITNHISDFAAMNLLATASTHQETF